MRKVGDLFISIFKKGREKKHQRGNCLADA